jgi:hypothetical protein
MLRAYNFLASWQLFPEKGNYEHGERPKSGIYRIEGDSEKNEITIYHNWVSLENQAFSSEYTIVADGDMHAFPDESFADQVQVNFPDGISFEIHFYRAGKVLMHVVHEIMPNGYLSVTSQGSTTEGKTYTNRDIYHKQMSVLPYSASVSGAVIRPTEEGVIRHKALTAMEEQTNMQLTQIRKQIELLALQAQEIQKRKDLSLMIYGAKLNFSPVIGQVYYLYEKKDDSLMISMVSPKEWGGGSGPFKCFVAKVQLLADHTWNEII